MEQHQFGDDQSLARSVSMAAEANEAAATANAALAQMRRNLREIRHLYSIIDDFHQRITIVNRRSEAAISETERLFTERSGTEIGSASKRVEVSIGEDGLPVILDWSTPWQGEFRSSGFDTGAKETDSNSGRSEDAPEL